MRHVLRVLDAMGDCEIQWNPDDASDVERIRHRFDELRSRRHYVYRTDTKDGKPEVMHAFDPRAASMIAAPELVGG